jgi:hypothetical protein
MISFQVRCALMKRRSDVLAEADVPFHVAEKIMWH